MGGSQCRLSILRKGSVPCHYFRNVLVDYKKLLGEYNKSQPQCLQEMAISHVTIF